MKTELQSISTLALTSLLTCAVCGGWVSAQTVLDLDLQPAFDFGADPAADPLFAPETLGLTNGLAGYDPVAAVSAFAAAARDAFPPSYEVFLSCWGNPRYALLPEPAAGAAALSATSPLGLASAFRGAGPAPNVVPGRTAGWAGEPAQARLNGVLYELPGTLKYVSPLVLDLDGDGVLGASRGLWLPHPARLTGPYAAFDMDGDGFQDLTEWVAASDGLLVTSHNPSSGRDLVGTAGGWRDGFEQLAACFDLDHNGRVEGPELAGLYVWRDANTNAVAEAGEVVSAPSLGIRWLATTHSGYLSGYGYVDTAGLRTNALWDWWPNYARANRRSLTPPETGHPLLGQEAMAAIRTLLFGRVTDDPAPARTTGLSGPRHLSPAQLAAAGVDLASFRLALLADGGSAIIGYDTVTSTTGPGRARVICVRIDAHGYATAEAKLPLPFEEVYQLACNPAGRMVLALGNQGSKLAVVDLKTGTVAPPEGLDLRSLGLRASGVAGDPMVRYSGTGNFWFSAWQLDAHGAVVDERVWALTPWGLWGGLSLEALRQELGPLRCHFITGPTSGFFAVPGPGGTNEQLWSVTGTNRVLVNTADAFGGLDAIPGQVVYTLRTGSEFNVCAWKDVSKSWNWQLDATNILLATSSVPFFYPFITHGGGAAVALRLNALNSQMDWDIWDTYRRREHDHIANFLGVGKVSRGALALHDADGIEILPVPDAPEPPPPPAWHYTLLNGSTLIDDCPICGRPTIPYPLRGSFDLRLIDQNPLFATYAVENVAFEAGGTPARFRITGRGTYLVGGEVGLVQEMFLELRLDDGITNRLCYFTNNTSAVERPWPNLKISLTQTNGDIQFFRLELAAAPLRELWFSTGHGFTPGVRPPYTNYVTDGDLVSSVGRVVKRNQELTAHLGFMPVVPDLGLDAVDLLPGGEIAFSIETNWFSESLGLLHEGDVLSDRGRVVTNFAALISAFGPEPPPADQGLDALHVLSNGEIYFSVERDFFSESLGRMIRKGDLLSSRGVIVKTNEELIARFLPAFPKEDYGLDAVHVWPSGEVWFSVERDFYGQHFERYGHGDLLSDQGYVVVRNLDLLAEFQPLEDLADFGLDGLFVVSDADVPASTTAGPATLTLALSPATRGLRFDWTGAGRVFQVEKATNVTGPWLPLSPVLIEPPVREDGVLTNTPLGFYRLRQW